MCNINASTTRIAGCISVSGFVYLLNCCDYCMVVTKVYKFGILCAQDGRLTKAEIVDKYDLFVGSQATDFGEALTRHDEF